MNRLASMVIEVECIFVVGHALIKEVESRLREGLKVSIQDLVILESAADPRYLN